MSRIGLPPAMVVPSMDPVSPVLRYSDFEREPLARDHEATGVGPGSHKHRVAVAGGVDRGLDRGELVGHDQGAAGRRWRRRGARVGDGYAHRRAAFATVAGGVLCRRGEREQAVVDLRRVPGVGERRVEIGAERFAVLQEGDRRHADIVGGLGGQRRDAREHGIVGRAGQGDARRLGVGRGRVLDVEQRGLGAGALVRLGVAVARAGDDQGHGVVAYPVGAVHELLQDRGDDDPLSGAGRVSRPGGWSPRGDRRGFGPGGHVPLDGGERRRVPRGLAVDGQPGRHGRGLLGRGELHIGARDRRTARHGDTFPPYPDDLLVGAVGDHLEVVAAERDGAGAPLLDVAAAGPHPTLEGLGLDDGRNQKLDPGGQHEDT